MERGLWKEWFQHLFLTFWRYSQLVMRFFVLLSTVIILAALPQKASAAASWCKDKEVPDIEVSIIEDPVVYDNGQSFKELSLIQSDTVNPYGPSSAAYTFGLAQREFRLDQKSELKMLANSASGEVCL